MNLSTAPATLTRRLRVAKLGVIRSYQLTDGATRVYAYGTEEARAIANHLIQLGYDAAATGDRVTVTLPEPGPLAPTTEARESAIAEALTEEEVPETGGVIRQEEHGARYFTAEERAAEIAAEALTIARTETVEQWGPDAVVVTREYDAPACGYCQGRGMELVTGDPSPLPCPNCGAVSTEPVPAWMGEVVAVGEDLRAEGVLSPARRVAEDNALADALLPYRLEQSDRNAWQVMDRRTGALWGTVHRREESMRPGVVQWTRWVAYRADGSHAHHTDSLPGAARLLIPLTEQAQTTLAERAEEPAKRPCWHVTTWGGETYGVAAYTADDAQALVNLRIRTEDANDWPVAAEQVGLWEAEPGTVLHY